jgi:hypothetical protein
MTGPALTRRPAALRPPQSPHQVSQRHCSIGQTKIQSALETPSARSKRLSHILLPSDTISPTMHRLSSKFPQSGCLGQSGLHHLPRSLGRSQPIGLSQVGEWPQPLPGECHQASAAFWGPTKLGCLGPSGTWLCKSDPTKLHCSL